MGEGLMRFVRAARIADLKPFDGNPRIHGELSIQTITRSIERFGWTNPVLAQDGTGYILAGAGRVEAARAAGLKTVPAVFLKLADRDASAYAIADNQIPMLAACDMPRLKELLAELDQDGFDITLTGFSDDDLEHMLGGEAGDDTDDLPAPPTQPITKRGDTWQLGPHRLRCGDATFIEDMRALLGRQSADLVVSSPPYNVGISYQTYKDRASRDAYLKLISGVAAAVNAVLSPGRFVAWNVGVSPQSYPHHHVVRFEEAGFDFYRQIVWRKQGIPYPVFPSTRRAMKARHYHPNYTHEVIYLLEKPLIEPVSTITCRFCDGSGKAGGYDLPCAGGHGQVVLFTKGEIELGEPQKPNAQYPNDVWDIAQQMSTVDLATLGHKSQTLKGSKHAIKEHPAAFPIELPRALIGYLTSPGERVLDPFGGSGSTLIAAEKKQRIAYLMELDPKYCDVIVERWQRLTGKKAIRKPTQEKVKA